MKYIPHCLALCGIGLVLVIAGAIWSASVGDKLAWTEEQATKLNEASASYHQAAHAHGALHHSHDDHGHEEEEVTDEQLAAVKADWEAQLKQRDDAIAWRDFWRKALYGSGMTAIIVGGAGYLLAKNVMDNE